MATKSKGKAGGAPRGKGKRPRPFGRIGKASRLPRKPKDQRKRVSVKLIKADTAEGKPIFSLIARSIERHHDELTQARVAVAWNLAWKPDADGVRVIGAIRKASDLDRELNGGEWDFVILLCKEYWETAGKDAAEREKIRAFVIDEQLCKITARLQPNGEPMIDERGRRLYRTRKYPVQAFPETIYRHGLYSRALVDAFNAARKSGRQMSIGEKAPDPKAPPSDADKGKAALSGLKGVEADKPATSPAPPVAGH